MKSNIWRLSLISRINAQKYQLNFSTMNCIRTWCKPNRCSLKNIINWIYCKNYAFELTLRRLSRKSARFVRAITACDNGFHVHETDYCGSVSARWVNKRKYSDEMYKSPFIDRNDEKKKKKKEAWNFSHKHLTRNSRQSVRRVAMWPTQSVNDRMMVEMNAPLP